MESVYGNPSTNVKEIAEKNNLIHSSDEKEIEQMARDIVNKQPDKVEQYKNGNKNLIGLFMGQLMKASKGKVDPKIANQLIKNILEE